MNYYNEHDPKMAAWLRELIVAEVIPPGWVDQRSIKDVRATDLVEFCQCHFFAGLGGWPFALALAGWPEDRPVWTGSCPCQPFSGAGNRKGAQDSRHLWPWFRHLVFRCRPAIAFGEQVASPDGLLWLAGVRANLETLGYAVGAADLCAAGVSAPHARQRLYWVADSDQRGRHPRSGEQPSRSQRKGGDGLAQQRGGAGGVAVAEYHRCERRQQEWPGASATLPSGDACRVVLADRSGRDARRQGTAPARYRHPAQPAGNHGAWSEFDMRPFRDGKQRRVESGTFPLAHGVPGRVGLLRGYGNAIVPQVAAEFIGAWLDLSENNPAQHSPTHD